MFTPTRRGSGSSGSHSVFLLDKYQQQAPAHVRTHHFFNRLYQRDLPVVIFLRHGFGKKVKNKNKEE